ncbi:hypothetical protein ACX80J_03155 [Arthrobacter sp. MDB2-24]
MAWQKDPDAQGTRAQPPLEARLGAPRARQQVTDCCVALTALLVMAVILYFTFQYNGR